MDNLEKEFKDISNHFMFFCVDNKDVGYMKYILKNNSLEIERLYMLKDYKGIGAGSEFLVKAEEIAILNGKKTLILGVLEVNKSAILFYKKKGFKQYSKETVIVGKHDYNLLLLKKEINDIVS